MDFSDQEYEAQFYGFDTKSFAAEVKEVIDDVLTSSIESVSAKLKKHYESSSVDQFAQRALQAYRASIERHTPDLEEAVKRYFSINPAICLPEDEIQDIQYSDEEERELLQQLTTARMEDNALVIMEQKLKEHLGTLSDNIQMLDQIPALDDTASDLNRVSQQINECVNQNFSSALIESLIGSLSLNDDFRGCNNN